MRPERGEREGRGWEGGRRGAASGSVWLWRGWTLNGRLPVLLVRTRARQRAWHTQAANEMPAHDPSDDSALTARKMLDAELEKLDAELPPSADSVHRRESSGSKKDFDPVKEQSILDGLPSADMFKKKKKKRVGGLTFAAQVEEQVIQTNEEDLTLRREHWQTIQQKASDPNTVSAARHSPHGNKSSSGDTLLVSFQVYSNENSGNNSPMRTREALDADALADDSMVVHMLDHAELGSKVLENLESLNCPPYHATVCASH